MNRAATAQRSYALTHLEVYDWGAFSGRHSAPIDLAGTAIIGPTGSGKTTLVDALMTLLCANPRYNLASTGGHESDRDLVSYVRGVSGAGNDGDGNDHIARPGAVVSAISARFSDGEAVVRLGGLFWLDGSSSAVADLKRRWLFCQADAPGLDAWLQAHHDGGARALKELERESPGLRVYEAKQPYLARLRSHFEVGENAFSLLNRAAGLKQLNSIDLVFRELVLDDRSAFDSARAVADEFDTLAGIRQELETARRQRDSLLPIARHWAEHGDAREALEEHRRLQQLLPIWFAERGAALWQRRLAIDEAAHAARQQQATALAARIQEEQRRAHGLYAAYLQAGGGDVEQLRERIQDQRNALARCQRDAGDYQALATALGLDPTLSAEAVQANQSAARERMASLAEDLTPQQQTAWSLGARQQALAEQRSALANELDEARRRPGSNIPVPQQAFRSQLAAQLGLDEEALPFVAELVEVRPEAQPWRGAIERAIGSERLRILVDPAHAAAALAWVEGRDNRLHVRIHEASASAEPIRFFEDGFTRKLNFKQHPQREAVKRLLAGIDRHCVDGVQSLRRTPHAMTVQGLMSGRQGHFDKQDQKPLDRDWMTGFDNRDQLARLEAALSEASQAHEACLAEFRQARARAEDTGRSLGLLERIGAVVFEDVDLPGVQRQLDGLVQRLEALSSPQSDLGRIKRDWDDAEAALAGQRQEAQALGAELLRLERDMDESRQAISALKARAGAGLDAGQQALAARRLDLPQVDVPALLDQQEREQREAVQKRLNQQLQRCADIEQRLVRDMARAKQVDTGALSEVGTEMQDVPAFLERLRVLQDEALPEKLQRFLDYLNQSSEQGVTQLLSDIDNEVTVIEERIEDLNATLRRVDFQPGRYLQLEPRRVEHESLRSLQRARAQLRSAQLREDQGESHFQALSELVGLLRDAVDRRKTLGALALLDPRHRLQFSVLVVERETGRVIEKRTSSQGGSGGEKEIIASYVLTASLSYALCPQGSERPLFGTIVLDEAFSKSSQAVAGRIIRALQEFGLHALFVTPNKELRLLREHTRSAIVVHRRGAQATMTSLSWEALEAHARQRAPVDHEVAD